LRLLLATIAALLITAAPAAAKQVTETATLGTIRAELAYQTHKTSTPTGLTMRVFDGDTQIVDQAVSDDEFLSPAFLFVKEPSVSIVDLDGDGIGEAIFDLFTGGAHCCRVTRIYQGSTLIKLDTGNVGYALKDYDGDGIPEIDSNDDAFSGAYSSYAASLPPVLVLQLRDGALQTFTRDPSVAPTLKQQIKRFTKLLRKYRRKAAKNPVYMEVVRSALAGITADRCNLGDCDAGFALIDKAVAKGQVRASFRRQVKKDLGRFGYLD
jgi:hypothetical protein